MNNYEIILYLKKNVQYPIIKAVSFYRQLLKYGKILNTNPNIFTNANKENIEKVKYLIEALTEKEKIAEFLKDFKNKTPEIEKVEFLFKEINEKKEKEGKEKQKESLKNEISYIRIKSEVAARISNYIGELIITKSNLLGLIYKLKYLNNAKEIYNEFYFAYQKFDDTLSQLNELSLSINMVNFESLYTRLINTARELCNKSKNKRIKMFFAGEETLIEKEIITKISDPLVHLIRNSIDHGIEDVSERIKNGKNPVGLIRINTYSESNNVIIEVIDDGRGIDLEKIKTKILQKGFITSDKISKLNDRQLIDFIFKPGFSTADKITEISGRGVGMDIVKEAISNVNGVIDVVTKIKRGTKFVLKIPLSLSIIDALIIKCDNKTLSLPTTSVIGIIRYNFSKIKRILNKDVLMYKSQVVPIAPIEEVMNYKIKNNKSYKYVIITGVAEKRLGLCVDDIIGKQEIMVKMFNQYLGKVRGLIGATILGNGKVSLILDVKEIIDIYENRTGGKNGI